MEMFTIISNAKLNRMLEEVENSDSYEEALKVIGQHVTLIDEATGRIYGNEQFGRTV